jgi:hypothetical protein
MSHFYSIIDSNIVAYSLSCFKINMELLHEITIDSYRHLEIKSSEVGMGRGQNYFGGHFTFCDVKKRPGRLGRSVTRFRLSVRGR